MTRTRVLFAAAAAFLAFTGCSSSTGKPAAGTSPSVQPSSPVPSNAPSGTSTPAAAFKGPRIIIVMEENHSAGQILGSSLAPTINMLSGKGTTLSNMFATRHPSLPNYISLISGSTQGITSDCGKCNVDAPNLIDQLEARGISWKAYLQGLPAPCSKDVKTQGAYAKKHNPFDYFADIRDNPARCNKIVPLTELSTDIAHGTLPQFVWITPDLDHDMHGAGEGGNDAQLIGTADTWLGDLYRQLSGSQAWQQDTRLVITWDEGAGGDRGGQHTCCDGDAVGGHIPTVIVGPKVPASPDSTTYDHYALLRSVEAAYGLSFLGHAADSASRDIPALAK